MIEKIIRIRNVGRFKDCAPRGDVLFRKMTMIYAENGMGKTTLSSIWRSLATNRGYHIEERATLGSPDRPKVELKLASGKATFDNATWNTTISDIKIFDSAFIDENVYRGCYVEHEHKKNLHNFVLGEEGVNLARRVDSLDNEIRNHNNAIAEKEREIKGHILGGIGLKEFLSLPQVPDIDEVIGAKQLEIDAFRKSDEIRNKPSLRDVDVPILPVEGFKTLMERSVDGVSEEAETLTRQHINGCMDAQGESWISTGLSYIKLEKCPFCGQSLTGIHLVEAYRAYFGLAYKKLKQDVRDFTSDFEKLFSHEALAKIHETIAANEVLTNYWKQYISVDIPRISFEDMKEPWGHVMTTVQQRLRAKKHSPLDPIDCIQELESVAELFWKLQEEIDLYNQDVQAVNALIEEQKKKVTTGDASSLERELDLLRNTKVRFRPEVSALCSEYEIMVQEKKRLTQLKSQAKKDLDRYTESLFNQYQSTVNDYLGKFGADFAISNTNPNYQGGKPRCDYCIAINGQDVDPGDQKTPEGSACFKNTLSAGDKSTLALAFFFARLDQDSDRQEKLIILDDPISSLDAHRKLRTAQEIKSVLEKSKQVVVLSHDPSFLKSLRDISATQFPVKTLGISRSGRQGSAVKEWDLGQEVQSQYFKDYKTLSDYLENGANGDLVAIARCIRPLLEGNLRLRFPKEFPNTEWLGDFIKNIREAQPGEPLDALKEQLNALGSINDYSKRFHHEQNPNAHSETTSDNELQTYVRQTLKLIPGILAANT